MIRKLRLKKGDIPIKEIYQISKTIYYRKHDDKKERMKLDIIGARLIRRKNFEYDRHAKQWKQTEGNKRHIRFEFIVSSRPISYKRIDTVTTHKYPVTFVFYDIDLGWRSPFRWRTGSTKKPQFAKKGASKFERERVANANIKNGIQMDFFFKLEALLSWLGLLYGPDMTNHQLPLKANPEMIPYFDKTALYCIEKLLQYILSPRGLKKLKTKL